MSGTKAKGQGGQVHDRIIAREISIRDSQGRERIVLTGGGKDNDDPARIRVMGTKNQDLLSIAVFSMFRQKGHPDGGTYEAAEVFFASDESLFPRYETSLAFHMDSEGVPVLRFDDNKESLEMPLVRTETRFNFDKSL